MQKIRPPAVMAKFKKPIYLCAAVWGESICAADLENKFQLLLKGLPVRRTDGVRARNTQEGGESCVKEFALGWSSIARFRLTS
jgi:hypothetical protein